MNSVVKESIPLEVVTTAQRLVQNGSIIMAGYFMLTYFKRCWKVDEDLAKFYTTKWFEKYFPNQLEKHRQKVNSLKTKKDTKKVS